MPFARRTPFGTSYGNVTDEERMNMQTGMFNAQRQDAQRSRDLQSELALRQLSEMGRQFDLGRQDRGLDRQSAADLAKMGYDFQSSMFDKQGAREDARFGKQFDYMASRDAREDAFRNKQFDFMNRNAGLQDEMLKSQLALSQLMTRGEEEKIRRQQAAAGTDLTPLLKGGALTAEEQAQQQAMIAANMDPVAATLSIAEQRKRKAGERAGTLAGKLGTDFRRFVNRDTAWFRADPSEQEKQNIVQQFQSLVQAYMEAGDTEPIAQAKAQKVIEDAGLASDQGDDFDTDMFAGNVRALLQQLGVR